MDDAVIYTSSALSYLYVQSEREIRKCIACVHRTFSDVCIVCDTDILLVVRAHMTVYIFCCRPA